MNHLIERFGCMFGVAINESSNVRVFKVCICLKSIEIGTEMRTCKFRLVITS